MSNSVLIIDDSDAVRERIIKTLEAFGLFSRYYEAEDGLEGFKKLLSSRWTSSSAIWRCRVSTASSSWG